jgi:hypothetical protein
MKTGGWAVCVYLHPFFHLRARRELLIKATPRSLHPWEKERVLFIQDARWVSGPVWAVMGNLVSTGIRSPDHPTCSVSLYRLPYPASNYAGINTKFLFTSCTRVRHCCGSPSLCNGRLCAAYQLQ